LMVKFPFLQIQDYARIRSSCSITENTSSKVEDGNGLPMAEAMFHVSRHHP